MSQRSHRPLSMPSTPCRRPLSVYKETKADGCFDDLQLDKIKFSLSPSKNSNSNKESPISGLGSDSSSTSPSPPRSRDCNSNSNSISNNNNNNSLDRAHRRIPSLASTSTCNSNSSSNSSNSLSKNSTRPSSIGSNSNRSGTKFQYYLATGSAAITTTTGSPVRKKMSSASSNRSVPSYSNWTIKLNNYKSDLSDLEFSQYASLGRLDKGAFGEVYKVHHKPSNKIYALKSINIEDSELRLDELLNEIVIMKGLHHPNLVTLYHYHLNENELNLIMEFCNQGSLRNLLFSKSNNKLSELETIKYVKQILNGLSYLHSNGIIHRDIKAGNLLLHDEIVKLGDFGVSVKLSSNEWEEQPIEELNGNIDSNNNKETTSLTEPHGSPYWMAPEVIKLQGCSTKSDIWSLGATIVELLTGKPPFYDYGTMPACHAIGRGEHIALPGYLSKDCKSFLYDCCFVLDPLKRANVNQLMEHKWIKGGKLLKYKESRKEDFGKEFELSSIGDNLPSLSPIPSKRKSMKLEAYKESANDEFTDGFEDTAVTNNRLNLSHTPSASASSTFKINPKHSRLSIFNYSLDQLRNLNGDFFNSYSTRKKKAFIFELVSVLYSDDISDEVKLEWIRISVYFFRSDMNSLIEFVSQNDQFRVILELYDQNSNIVISFLELFFSKIEIDKLKVFYKNGGLNFICKIIIQNKEITDDYIFMVNILFESFQLYNNEDCRYLSTGLLAKKIPIRLCSNLVIANEELRDDMIILLDFTFQFSFDSLQEEILDLSFYEDLFRVFNLLDTEFRLRSLTQLTRDSRYRSITAELSQKFDICESLVSDLVFPEPDYRYFELMIKSSIIYFDCLSKSYGSRILQIIDKGNNGLEIFTRMLKATNQYPELFEYKDKLIRMFNRIFLQSSQDLSTEFRIGYFVRIITLPKYRSLAIQELEKIIDIHEEEIFNQFLNSHSALASEFVRSLRMNEEFEPMVKLLLQIIPFGTFRDSQILRKLSTSSSILNSLLSKIKSNQFGNVGTLSLLKCVFLNCRPLTPTLRSFQEKLQSLSHKFTNNSEEASLVADILALAF